MPTSENSKKLIKNVLLFTLSTFLPKVLSFFMVPVYTAYLTTSDYGTSDLIITTASLLLPVFTLAVSNAVIRFTIENKKDQRTYIIAVKIYVTGSIILALLLTAVGVLFLINAVYLILVFLLFAASALYQIKVAYLRGMERIPFLTVCGIVNSFVSLSANIIFIVVFRWGMYGFVLSSILGYLVVDVMIAVGTYKDHIYRTRCLLRKEKKYAKEMLSYSIPLIFSGLAWWINSVSDRYIVSWIMGVAATGVYSVAYKIPTMLQLVQDIFGPAWNLSVFDVYDKEEGDRYINNIYDFYNFIMVFACSVLIFMDKPLARFLFSNEFYEAWRYVPVLLMSVVFIGMGACAGPILNAYKKSGLAARGSIYSACTNVVLNIILIKWIGVQGAAIATLISYFVSWIYQVIQAKKLCGFFFDWKKHGFMYVMLLIETLVVLYCSQFWVSIVFVVLIMAINIENCRKLMDKLKYTRLELIHKITGKE